MPKTVIIADPTDSGTVGLVLTFVRVATGAGGAGVEVRLDVPGEPGSTYVIPLTALSGADRTALATIYANIITLFKAARGYV